MKFVIEIDHNFTFLIKRAVENELIRLKGRAEMDKNNYGIDPSQYTLDDIASHEAVIKTLKENKMKVVYEDIQNEIIQTSLDLEDCPF